MRRTIIAATSAAALTAVAFAPAVGVDLPRTAAEVLANPQAVADAYRDMGPEESFGDLLRSVQGWPDAQRGNTAEATESSENLEFVARIDLLDVLGEYETGATGDIGTFMEFFSPWVPGDVVDGVQQPPYKADVAVMGINGIGAVLIDITDPANPERLSVAYCDYHQADVGAYNVGEDSFEGQRWVLAVGADTGLNVSNAPIGTNCFDGDNEFIDEPAGGTEPVGGAGTEALALWDVTDVTNPVPQRAVTTQYRNGAAHTIELDPTRPHAYIASALVPNVTRVDFTDPQEPVLIADVITEGGPHAVRVSADGQRMYAAGSFSQTMTITDISNPDMPIPVGVQSTPRNVYTHEVLPSHDRSFVIVADEGAYDPGYSFGWCPGTGFWVYDMAVENLPVPLSYTVIDDEFTTTEGQGCAVHYGNLSADDRYYTVAYYGAGVRVFDLADPTDPVEIGHAMFLDSDVWTAKAYRDPHHVFVSDLNRGFEVYRWTGDESVDLSEFE